MFSRKRARSAVAPDAGPYCPMCDAVTAVDVHGRCPLGHTVTAPQPLAPAQAHEAAAAPPVSPPPPASLSQFMTDLAAPSVPEPSDETSAPAPTAPAPPAPPAAPPPVTEAAPAPQVAADDPPPPPPLAAPRPPAPPAPATPATPATPAPDRVRTSSPVQDWIAPEPSVTDRAVSEPSSIAPDDAGGSDAEFLDTGLSGGWDRPHAEDATTPPSVLDDLPTPLPESPAPDPPPRSDPPPRPDPSTDGIDGTDEDPDAEDVAAVRARLLQAASWFSAQDE